MVKKRDRQKNKPARGQYPWPLEVLRKFRRFPRTEGPDSAAPPEGPPGWRTRVTGLAFPALLLGLQLGLISGWNVYRGNQAEFDHGMLDLMPIFLAASVVGFIIFWIGPLVLPSRSHERSVALLTMLGLLLYVQGNLLVWDYGVFHGGELQWASNRGKGWLELALWGAALAWTVIRPRMLFRFSRVVCLGLVGLQIGSLMIASLSAEEGYWHREGSFADMPPSEIYQYSRGTNVVHIVMDAFQTDVFQEIVAEDGIRDQLDGFVLYQENLGVAAHTSFAIPAIFSGEIFDGSENPDAYYRRCVNELGFQNLLFDAGYRVNLMPRLRMDESRYSNNFRVPDVFGGSRGSRQRQAAGRLLDVGLFRQVPHFAKKWVHNSGQWRVSGLISGTPVHRSFHQRAFLDNYIAEIDPVLEQPTYSFIHLMSPHPPYGTRADGTPSAGPMPLTRESYKNEARYTLRTFLDLLRRLRELGIYDDAFIILQGDHGIDFPPVIDGKAVNLPVDRAPTLLVVKVPGAAGPLTTSPAPSSIADIPATVTEVLGLREPIDGTSLLELPADAERERGFFQYLGGDRDAPVLRRFTVTGSIFDPSDWLDLGDVELEKEAPFYAWGDVVEFGMEGNAGSFTGRGWAAPLSHGQWTDGKRADLSFQIEPPEEEVVFLLAMRPFLAPGKLDRQRVNVLVNGAVLTTLDLTTPKPQLHKLTIPGSMLDSRKVVLTLELPDASVPKDLGVSGDERQLGVSVISVCLFPQSRAEEILRRTAESGPGPGH